MECDVTRGVGDREKAAVDSGSLSWMSWEEESEMTDGAGDGGRGVLIA